MADDKQLNLKQFQLTIAEFKSLKAELAKSAEYQSASITDQKKMLAGQLKAEKQSLIQSKSGSVQSRLLALADKRDAKKVSDDDKAAKKERANEEKNLQILQDLHGLGKFAKMAQLKAAKLAQTAKGKIKDFAKDKISGIKKAAGSLMDLLGKGLGLAALYLVFAAIKKWDIMAIWEGVKTAGKVILNIGEFFLSLGTSVSAFLGIDKLKQMFGGKEGKLAGKIRRLILSVRIWMSSFTGKGSFLGKIGDLFKSFMGLFSKIPGMKTILKFVKTFAKIAGKLFMPVTVIMALWEAVSGFMDGFANTEGNMLAKIVGGIGGSIKALLDFFIFGIADMVQSAIIWLLELFGFDGAATAVGDFNLVQKIKDIAFGIIDWFTSIFQDPLAALGVLWNTMTGGYATIMDLLWSPVQAGIVWMMKLFGWDEAAAATESFSIEGFINGIFDTIKGWFTGIFAWGMAAGETEDGAWSIMTFINSVIKTVKGWVTGLFSWASSEDEEDSFIMSTIKKTITGVKEWFGKMFKFDSASNILASYINLLTFFPNMIKDAIAAVTTYLLKLFGFDEAAEKVANANKFSIGEMIMNVITDIVKWFEKIFDIDIGAIFKESLGALGKAGGKILGWLGMGGESKEDLEEKVNVLKAQNENLPDTAEGNALKASNIAQMKSLYKSIAELKGGGLILPGGIAMVGEAGPELVINQNSTAKVIPAKQSAEMMSGMGGGSMVNAPTTNVVTNNNSSSSGMMMASSSIDPMHAKYFRS